MKKMRSHPINILENTSSFLILLLLPALRLLITSQEGLSAWVSGVWFDLLIIFMIIAIGIYEWYVFTFTVTENGIYIQQGVFLKKQRFLSFRQMTAIAVESPWYFLPLRAVRLKADTDAGSPRKADFTITVRTTLSEEILVRSKQPFLSENSTAKAYTPSNRSIIIFSLLASNSLTGIIYLYAAFREAGNILGEDISNKLMHTFTELAMLISFGLPPFFAMIAYFILICWGVSFLLNLFRHLRFYVRRKDGIIEIQSGIFTVRHFSITAKRVNFITLRQSLLSRMFGVMSVFIHCTGYGKENTELSVLLPAGRNQQFRQNIKRILPEIPFTKRQIKPKLVNLSRFLIPPGSLILLVLGIGLLLSYLLTGLDKAILFMTIILEIPCVWWLVVKIYSFLFTGIGVNHDVVTIYYTRGFSVITSSIPMHKITKIETSQSLFQLSTKCCDVMIFTHAEHIKRQKILNMYLPEVRELLDPERLPFSPPDPPKKKKQTKRKFASFQKKKRNRQTVN